MFYCYRYFSLTLAQLRAQTSVAEAEAGCTHCEMDQLNSPSILKIEGAF
jgi:hypothetical protein